MKSLELGIKMRSDLEKNLYEKVIELSKKRQTELIKEGKLPNFDYTGVQILSWGLGIFGNWLC